MTVELCAFADEAADDLEGQIAALKRNHINKIELRNLNGCNVKDLSEETAKEAGKRFSEAGITVWSIGSPIGKSELFDDFLKTQKDLEHILRLCDIFNCKRIRVFSFFAKEYEYAKIEVIRRLRLLVNQAAESGVTLYHENEKDIFGDIASRVETLLHEVKGLKSVFDPANYLQVGESKQNIAKMRKVADYYHIKDALVSGEIVPAGEGDGDIFGLISELNQDAVLTVEPHLAVFTGYSTIDGHALKNCYQFASRDEAFDAAVNALKKILFACGYKEETGKFVK